MADRAEQVDRPAVEPHVTEGFAEAAIRNGEAVRTESGRVVLHATAEVSGTRPDEPGVPAQRNDPGEVYGPEVNAAHRLLQFELVAGLMQRDGVPHYAGNGPHTGH